MENDGYIYIYTYIYSKSIGAIEAMAHWVWCDHWKCGSCGVTSTNGCKAEKSSSETAAVEMKRLYCNIILAKSDLVTKCSKVMLKKNKADLFQTKNNYVIGSRDFILCYPCSIQTKHITALYFI